MSAPPPPDPNALATAAYHLFAAKLFSVASFTMLVYDHLVTFSDEVERIWKQRWTGATLLFVLNRYLPIIQFIIVYDAFFDSRWSVGLCNRFVRFEGSSTIALIGIAEIITILRVYALYRRSLPILVFLLTVFFTQISVMAAAVHFSERVPLPPGFVGCILTGTNFWFHLFWTSPLATDTSVFLLTLWASRQYLRYNVRMPILHLFLRDGVLYYAIIFTANLMNTLIYIFAPADLKAIGASFSQLVTATMVSRLQLNLRVAGTSDEYRGASVPPHSSHTGGHTRSFSNFSAGKNTRYSRWTHADAGTDTNTWISQTKTFVEHAVGNLGDELDVGGYLGHPQTEHWARADDMDTVEEMPMDHLMPMGHLTPMDGLTPMDQSMPMDQLREMGARPPRSPFV